ncbi:hypothetical protein LGM42_09950 [Burkholderia sp. AU39826]|uniref:hypothetical protein n=1 Tax=Burkholderia sp. AU39826 TaxID=2879634 RepID=UPI001CF54345|nr:hypothetical protein [Burkholderia sp. AU39826]MCA7970208.1 hypothetical protein [Burkholderia sp. AU39826]
MRFTEKLTLLVNIGAGPFRVQIIHFQARHERVGAISTHQLPGKKDVISARRTHPFSVHGAMQHSKSELGLRAAANTERRANASVRARRPPVTAINGPVRPAPHC